MKRYLPTPPPQATHEAAQFWEWCRKRELRFQRCVSCHRARHPPAPFCPYCRSGASDWVAPGVDARLFSFTVVHHAVSERLRPYVPYNIAIVEFADLGVRLVSNVIDLPPERLAIGMSLKQVWQDSEDGAPLPLFTGGNPK
jgi:uncharacterized OB-fold protein